MMWPAHPVEISEAETGAGWETVWSQGICHSFAADGRCISLLKILFTNECLFDCHYCINRCSDDVPRAAFTPDEVCRLTMEFYRRNYIEGLFLKLWRFQESRLSRWQRLYQTLYRLRTIYHFQGLYPCEGDSGAGTGGAHRADRFPGRSHEHQSGASYSRCPEAAGAA